MKIAISILLLVLVNATMILGLAPVFVETEELQQLREMSSLTNLKIIDCTLDDNAVMSYHQSHIPGS